MLRRKLIFLIEISESYNFLGVMQHSTILELPEALLLTHYNITERFKKLKYNIRAWQMSYVIYKDLLMN
jgi:hypothetical protein